MDFAFSKMHGAANDFVVVDHREPFLPVDATLLFARLCDRRRGVGADGVLLLERDPEHDFSMRYFNRDGIAADFCGNGARCIARFAIDRGLGAEGSVTFRTAVGVKRARELRDGRIALWFGAVGGLERIQVEALGRVFAGSFGVTGVPHFVVPVEEINTVAFDLWSPALRHHPHFGAPGANVDYVARGQDGRIAMRTWERGVEAETLASAVARLPRRCGRWGKECRHPSPCSLRAAMSWWSHSRKDRRGVRPLSRDPRRSCSPARGASLRV